jgi:hypothetical protein
VEAAQNLSLFILYVALRIIEVNESQCDQKVSDCAVNSLVNELDEDIPAVSI